MLAARLPIFITMIKITKMFPQYLTNIMEMKITKKKIIYNKLMYIIIILRTAIMGQIIK